MRHNFGSHFLQIWTVVFPHKIPWDFHSHTLIWFSTSACYCGGQFLWWKDHLFNTRLLWWARACVRACMRTCVRACVRACGRSCMCVCVRAYVCVCVCGGWVIAAAQEWCVQNVREVRECERSERMWEKVLKGEKIKEKVQKIKNGVSRMLHPKWSEYERILHPKWSENGKKWENVREYGKMVYREWERMCAWVVVWWVFAVTCFDVTANICHELICMQELLGVTHS